MKDNNHDENTYHCEYCTYETPEKNCFDSHLKYHDKDKASKNEEYYCNNYLKGNQIFSTDADFVQM